MTGWMIVAPLAALVVGLTVGIGVTVVLMRARHRADTARLQAERDLFASQAAQLSQSASEADELAMTLGPLTSSLARMERQVGQLEKDSVAQWGRLGAQLSSVAATETTLQQQTADLAGALRSGTVRGSWGEVQLRRIVEHAGLLARVDITEQMAAVNDLGAQVRPDAVVHLPGGKHIVIDAKAPLADDDQGQAKRVRAHVAALAAKRYWTAFDATPEFVVCFIASEGLLAGACRADPGLLEAAMARRVVIATPTTLLAMLRTVALTWQQDTLVGNAHEVVDLGRQLHERLVDLGAGMAKLGRTLDRAVIDFNTVVAHTDTHVLDRARRLGELGVTDQLVPELVGLQSQSRLPHHPGSGGTP